MNQKFSFTHYLTVLTLLMLLGAIIFTVNNALQNKELKNQSAQAAFTTLPPGSALPNESQCATQIVKTPERIQGNQQANTNNLSTQGVRLTGSALANYGYETKVTGNFAGTTDEILQWGACKWGFDEDSVRAVAAALSKWDQAAKAECNNQGQIQPETNGCQSVGILRVKAANIPATHPGTWPHVMQSTAFNVDYALAYMRACFEGKLPDTGTGYVGGDEWGCYGMWYSGAWKDGSATGFILGAQNIRQTKEWLTYGSSTGVSPMAQPSTTVINPTYGVIAPCPSCVDPTMTPPSSGGTVPSGSQTLPSGTVISQAPIDPCNSTASLANEKPGKKKSKHKNHDGGLSKGMEAFINFLFELILLLLKLFITNPGTPQIPTPDVTSTPMPCEPTDMPAPSPAPSSTQPTTPAVSPLPSLGISPSLLPSQPVNIADRIFSGDYESGNVSQWPDCHTQADIECSAFNGTQHNIKVVTEPKRQGKYAARFELRDGEGGAWSGNERTETLEHIDKEAKEGAERWYQWSTQFTPEFANAAQAWAVVTQWHDETNESPPLSFDADQTGKWWLVRNGSEKLWEGPLTPGSWHDMKLHIVWSADANKGLIELWHNGTKQTFSGGCTGTTCKIATLRPASGIVYVKQGIYRKDVNTATAVLFHDGFSIAKTEAGLVPLQ